MKRIKTKSGINGYQCHLQDNYGSFTEFREYDAVYNLTSRLGFKTAKEAWQANPVIQGSTNPEDFCTVTPVNEGQQQPVQGEGFTPGEWEVDNTSVNGISIWANSERDNGILLASVWTEARGEEAEANARLIAHSKQLYYALKNLSEIVPHSVDSVAFSKELTAAKQLLNSIVLPSK